MWLTTEEQHHQGKIIKIAQQNKNPILSNLLCKN